MYIRVLKQVVQVVFDQVVKQVIIILTDQCSLSKMFFYYYFLVVNINQNQNQTLERRKELLQNQYISKSIDSIFIFLRLDYA